MYGRIHSHARVSLTQPLLNRGMEAVVLAKRAVEQNSISNLLRRPVVLHTTNPGQLKLFLDLINRQ